MRDLGRRGKRNSHLVKRIAAEAFVTPLTAETTVDMVFSEIGEALSREGKVTVRGFGTFMTTSRAERVGRNPRTGEPIEIPASKFVSLKASKVLKDKERRPLLSAVARAAGGSGARAPFPAGRHVMGDGGSDSGVRRGTCGRCPEVPATPLSRQPRRRDRAAGPAPADTNVVPVWRPLRSRRR